MAYSEAQKKATMKYMRENYDEIRIRVKKGNKQLIENVAKTQETSLAGYVRAAINEKLKKDGQSLLE